ncbi:DUF11 domain-containing protein [Leucobacter viscericola]|uniref:DUF11 domain-containing protein n=1 Tax=Leucobacter viscericola TaxID=2714935 RepID=A0A6G7XG43_9MICO|nr:DUF11 domain-containing protein [Leucobacter viscericola]QIK63341.1 DUF11 domain-containing protein [Leucobacter viscericola]
MSLHGGARRVLAGAVAGTMLLATFVLGPLPVGSIAPADAATTCGPPDVALVNAGFEQPTIPAGKYRTLAASAVPGWDTTDSKGMIEIWSSGFNGVPAAAGTQFAELNAFSASMLSQDVATTPGQVIHWSLMHRARSGTDVMAVEAGVPGTTLTELSRFGDNVADGWVERSGSYVVPAGQTQTRFGFEAISSGSGNPSQGNFLDAISFGTAPCVVATKTSTVVSGAPVVVGSTMEYTVLMNNQGGSSAQIAAMTDTLQPGLEYLPGSMSSAGLDGSHKYSDASGDDQAEYDSATNKITFRLGLGANATKGGSLPPGETVRFTFRATVTAAAASTNVTNSATVSYQDPIDGLTKQSVTDPVRDEVAAAADLEVLKSSPARAVAGQPITWAVSVTNKGPDLAEDVTLSELSHDGPVLDVKENGVDLDCPLQLDVNVCSLGSVLPGESRTLMVTTQLDSDTTAEAASNTAVVTSSTHEIDPSDNTSTATVPITTSADVAVTKTFTPANPLPGDEITYDLVVSNAGPSTARQVTLLDGIDPGTTVLEATIEGGDCAIRATSVLCSLESLAAGDARNASIRVVADPVLAEPLVQNSATVAAATPDPNPENNTASVSFNVPNTADLQLSKTAADATLTPGAETEYTLTLSNIGPAPAVNATVEEVPDPDLTILSMTGSDGAVCDTSSCYWSSIAPGENRTVTVAARLSSDTALSEIGNTASVSSPVPDPTPGNNVATVVLPIERSSDLVVSKQILASPVHPGDTVTSRITVTNNGPDVAIAPTVREANLWLRSPTVNTEAGRCVSAGPLAACRIPTLAVGASWVIDVESTLAPDYAEESVSNTVAVDTRDDPNPDNNVATASAAVDSIADLSIVKSSELAEAQVGAHNDYTITVRNNGPDAALSVAVMDLAGDGVAVRTGRSAVGNYATTSLTWFVGTLPAGASKTLVLGSTLEMPGTLSNTAMVTSASADPNLADNRSTASTVVSGPPVPPPVPPTPPYTPPLVNTGSGGNAAPLVAFVALAVGLGLLSRRRRLGRAEPTPNFAGCTSRIRAGLQRRDQRIVSAPT